MEASINRQKVGWFAPSLQYLPVRIRIRQDAEVFVDLMIEKLPQQLQDLIARSMALRRARAARERIDERRLSPLVETLCCANVPGGFFAVADTYRSWGDISEAGVQRILGAR